MATRTIAKQSLLFILAISVVIGLPARFALADEKRPTRIVVTIEKSQSISEVLWVWVQNSPYRLYGQDGMVRKTQSLNRDRVFEKGDLVLAGTKITIPEELVPYIGTKPKKTERTPAEQESESSNDLQTASAIESTKSVSAPEEMSAEEFVSRWGAGVFFSYIREHNVQNSNAASATLVSELSPTFRFYGLQDWSDTVHTGLSVDLQQLSWSKPPNRNVENSKVSMSALNASFDYDLSKHFTIGARAGARTLGVFLSPAPNVLSYTTFSVPTYGVSATVRPVSGKTRTAFAKIDLGMTGSSQNGDESVESGHYYGADVGFTQNRGNWQLGLQLFARAVQFKATTVEVRRTEFGSGLLINYALEEEKTP